MMWTRLLAGLALAAALIVAGTVTAPALGDDEAQDNGAHAFTLRDHEGNEVSLADFEDKIVVLEWINPGCPFVVRHYNEKTFVTLANDYKERGVVHLAINSTRNNTPEANKRWAEQHSLPYPVLSDAPGNVGRAYGARTTPHMYIIHEGKIVYQGAIDNDPTGGMQASERTNYVRNALDELLNGSEVSVSSTQPYGCNVHYASN